MNVEITCVCCVNRTLFSVFLTFALGSIKQSDLFDDTDQDICEMRKQKEHTVEERRQR